MAKRTKRQNEELEHESDGQIPLIDVDDPKAKPLKALATKIKKAETERRKIAGQVKAMKADLRDGAKQLGIQANEDGVLEFRTGDVIIVVTPHEDTVTIKDAPAEK